METNDAVFISNISTALLTLIGAFTWAKAIYRLAKGGGRKKSKMRILVVCIMILALLFVVLMALIPFVES